MWGKRNKTKGMEQTLQSIDARLKTVEDKTVAIDEKITTILFVLCPCCGFPKKLN